MICLAIFLFFFFKQKTAYEMRISDWSSDVALPIWVTNQPAVHPAVLEKSLVHHFGTSVGPTVVDAVGAVFRHERLEAARLRLPHELDERLHAAVRAMTAVCPAPRRRRAHHIGRASWRARVCRYV